MQPSSSQSSFIPKRGAKRAKRRAPIKRIFIFSLVAYSLVFAALIASAASFLYKNYVTSLLQNEVTLLTSEINTFSVADLNTLQQFDLKLQRAEARLENSASIVTALNAIDEATADPIQIINLTLERTGDETITLVAQIAAESFDAALFQRQLLTVRDGLFTSALITNVSAAVVSNQTTQSEGTGSNNQPVTFTATLEVPVQSLPYTNVNVQPRAFNASQEANNESTS